MFVMGCIQNGDLLGAEGQIDTLVAGIVLQGAEIGTQRDPGLRSQRYADEDRNLAIAGADIEAVLRRRAGHARGCCELVDGLADRARRQIDHCKVASAAFQHEQPLIGIIQRQGGDRSRHRTKRNAADLVELIGACRLGDNRGECCCTKKRRQRAPADHATTFCDC